MPLLLILTLASVAVAQTPSCVLKLSNQQLIIYRAGDVLTRAFAPLEAGLHVSKPAFR